MKEDTKTKKVLLLLSGGIDSPVVAYILKKRGFYVEAVHFYNSKLINKKYIEKVKRISKKVGIPLTIIDIKDVFSKISEGDRRYFFVLLKRVMYRISEGIARKKGFDFLATGENLGQVSSQTLQNLFVINKSISMPVLRPLIAYDKVEIINFAEEIGTFEMSKGPELCNILGIKHPVTQARESDVVGIERKIGIDELIQW